MRIPKSFVNRVLSLGKKYFLPIRIQFALSRFSRPVIIQVGANDGISHDHVIHLIERLPKAEFILIEPLPDAFARLTQLHNYRTNVKTLNIAIDATCGQKEIFYIDETAANAIPGLPGYFNLLASFSRQHVASLVPTNLQDEFLKVRLVDALTLTKVLTDNNIANVHALFIDCEGWDLVALKSFPFHATKPKVVMIENNHIDPIELSQAYSWMRSMGYKVETYGMDTLFTLSSPRN